MKIILPPESTPNRAGNFIVGWYDIGGNDLIKTIMPLSTTGEGTGTPEIQPPLYSMIALEVWRIFVNKVKNWLTPDAIEPDEED